MHYSTITGLSFAFIIACAPGPAPVASSAMDPSNPNAAEGTTPAVLALSAAHAPAHDHDHNHNHQHREAATDATTYVCPMHPEVTSTAPGVCSKCNMKLVLKK